jgi:DNA-binding response OmpR family regulator
MTNSLIAGINESSLNNLAVSIVSTNSQTQSILLIENDQLLSYTLKQQLHSQGYKVEQRLRDDNFEQYLSSQQTDMVILDIGFSDVNGLSAIEKIRRSFDGPLVLLTSRDSEQEQVTAFNLGVDEYLVKPISANIFAVRIASLFRRYVKPTIIDENSQITAGDLTLYPFSRKCTLGEHSIALTQFEFKLLSLLAENAGKILSRDYIYNSLLGREYNGVERTVDVRVSQLRDKLTMESHQKTRIETIWGQGYMLNIADEH